MIIKDIVEPTTLDILAEWTGKNFPRIKVFNQTFLKQQQKLVFKGASFYKNSVVSHFLARDKKSTQLFLKSNGIDVLPQELFYLRGEQAIQDIIRAHEYAKNYSYEVVMKPNDQAFSKDVLRITSEDELYEKLYFFMMKYGHVNISEFLQVRYEYRCIVFKGKVEILFRKKIMSIIGDGKRTLFEHLCSNEQINIAEYLNNNDGIKNLNEIIPPGEEVRMGWKFYFGFSNTECTLLYPSNNQNDYLTYKGIISTAEKIASLMKLSVCSVDFYELSSGGFLCNEVNAGFSIENFYYLSPDNKEACHKLFRKIFK